MGLREHAIKTEKGQRLQSLEARVTELINQIKMCKSDLEAMLAEVQSNTELYDETDVQDVQEVLTSIANMLKEF